MGSFLGLCANRDQRRFGHGGGEADGKGKQIDPDRRIQRNQLLGHAPAHRKQPQLESDDKGVKSKYDHRKTKHDAASVGDGFANNGVLEKQDNQNNRQHITQHAEQIKQHGQGLPAHGTDCGPSYGCNGIGQLGV